MQQFRFLLMAVQINLKRALALRGALILSIFVTVLKQMLFLMAWKFFFQKYKMVQGWNFSDMLCMYGMVCFSMGFVEVFFYGIKEIPTIIDNGQLDTFLLQPKNIILNIAMSKGDVTSLGEIVTGLILISYSGYMISAFPVILLILILSIVFMFSLLLYLACLAFFMKNADDFIKELNLNSIIVASQPNAAYQGAFKLFTLTILPVAFLSYFPIEYLRTAQWYYLGITAIGTFVFCGIACWIFKMGIKRYESGNLIGFRT